MKTNNYVLDACALIALLDKEPGYEEIGHLLLRAELDELSVCINIVNLLEVYYDRIKISNMERANRFLEIIYNSSIEILEQQNKEIVRNAGKLKASYKISLADSFALSTAICKEATLITADHHEFDKIEQNEDIHFLWIR
jgi:PIN domain nuclease of toxin-antitoxin system